MGYKKTHDLSVVVGAYEKNGEVKKRYSTIGSVLTNDDGKLLLLLDRTFNPAGVTNPEDKDSVMVSMFPIKSREERQQSEQSGQAINPEDIAWGE